MAELYALAPPLFPSRCVSSPSPVRTVSTPLLPLLCVGAQAPPPPVASFSFVLRRLLPFPPSPVAPFVVFLPHQPWLWRGSAHSVGVEQMLSRGLVGTQELLISFILSSSKMTCHQARRSSSVKPCRGEMSTHLSRFVIVSQTW